MLNMKSLTVLLVFILNLAITNGQIEDESDYNKAALGVPYAVGNPITVSNVCSFPENWHRIAGFRALTARLGIAIQSDSYKELLNYPGTFQLTTQQSSTTKPNFQISGLVGTLYGLTIIPSYLLIELTGYFVPPTSGEYTFSLEGSDDAAIIFIANPSTFKCGHVDDWPTAYDNDVTVTDSIHTTRTIYMIEGVAYPIRIAYYNGLSLGKLQASFTDPEGVKRVDWNGYIWRYDACDTCSYVPPPTVVTTESSSWVLNPTTTGTSYSTALGIDGLPTTYTIYQVVVPTITESLAIPPPITQTDTHPDYLEEEVVSYYSTTNAEGSPITGTTTSTIRTILIIPPPITITVTKEGWEEEQEISYFSTTDANGNGITGTITKTLRLRVDVPTPYTTTYTSNYEQIEAEVSYIATVDEDGKPTYFTTTKVIAISHLPPPPGYTVTIDVGNEVTHYEVVSYFTTEDENGKFYTGTSTVTFTPPSPTTITVTKEGVEETDYISFFITTDAEHNIITGSSVSKILDDGLDKTTVVTDEDGTVHTDIISHITTTDAEGNPTIILTTYPSPTDDGLDKTTVVTDEDGTVHTDIISHIPTTDAEGNPTIILTTYPSPTDDGLDKTTVVTDEDGTVHTDIISHITTTDAEGTPTIILTTYPSPTDSIGNPIALSNVCSFPESRSRTAGFRVLTAGLGIWITSDSYKELLNYSGSSQLITQQSSTTQPNFEIGGLVGNIYGLTVVPSYLLVELTGYFVPPVSGEYSFSLEGSDDAAIIFIGNPSTFKCGNIEDWPTPNEADISVTDTIHASRTIYMVEGVAYPIRIAYYNGLSTGRLQASFTDPRGIRRVDWNGYIWRYDACDTCSYVPPPTVVTTESSSWVLNPTTTGTSYSTALGIDGLPTTYTIYQVVVPTITESLAIPPPITQTDTHPDYLEEEVVSYYSTTNAEGSPITGTTTSTIRTILIIPPPITITVTKEGWEEEQEISYFSTTDANGNGITGSTTRTITFHVDLPTPFTTTFTSNHEQIEGEVSYIPTVDEDGKPTYFTTTKVIAISHLPPPPGYTVTIDVGNEVTHYEVVSYFTTEDENGKFYTGTSTVTFTPPSPTTITVTKEGVEETDYISFFITTDAEHNIITGSSVSKILDDGLDKTTVVTDEDGTVHTDIISHITTTDAEGNPTIILTTYPSPTDDGLDKTTVVTDEDGTVHTDIISHITTTDAEGNPTIILTTYPSPTDDGLDKTTVVTDEDGTVHTDIISHITTTDAEGNPTIILTTYPSPTDDGLDKTTVVTDEDGTVHTDIISHITTTDAEGKPTTILTTYPSPTDSTDISVTDTIHASRTIYMVEGVAYPIRIAYYNGLSTGRLQASFTDPRGIRRVDWNGYIWRYDACDTCSYVPPPTVVTTESSSWVLNPTTTGTSYSTALTTYPSPTDDGLDKTTVVTDEDGTVHTDIISHITTTDAEGNPTIILTTYPSPTDIVDINTSLPQPSTTSYTEDGVVIVEVVYVTIYTASNGDMILTTITELSKEMIDAGPIWVSPTTSTVTTVDSNGNTLTITTSYLIDNNGNTGPIPNSVISSSVQPSDDGLDKTTVVTDEDGTVHTDIISHITTTDVEGNPTIILTTYLSPLEDGKDRPTVVSNSDSTLPPHKLPSSSRGNSDIEPSPTSNSISLPEIYRSVENNLGPGSCATIAAVISEDNSSSPVIMESDSFGTSDQSRLEGQSIGTDDFAYIETVDITVLETSLSTNETTSRHTSIIEGSVKGAAPSVKNNFTITVLPLIVVLALCVV
ncbi:hypothetical protein J7297_02982 [Nakaseomyces glabratus]|nr:hypothetical protein J7297_02982 [Nakaseomyces glabratus]